MVIPNVKRDKDKKESSFKLLSEIEPSSDLKNILELGILDSKVELTRYSDIRYIIGKN
jgi:hypothetical protein